jgi:hypothetical protein
MVNAHATLLYLFCVLHGCQDKGPAWKSSSSNERGC